MTELTELSKGMTIGDYRLGALESGLSFGTLWTATDSKHDTVWLEFLEPVGDRMKLMTSFLKLVNQQKSSAGRTPHVVPVISHELLEKHFCVVLQPSKRDPGWLADWRQEKRVDPARLRGLFETVCHAFEEVATTSGTPLVHGGFSSASVVRWPQDKDRPWRVMDFGLARVARSREPNGTPGRVEDYTAPEVFGYFDRMNLQSEVFALGVFFTELVNHSTLCTYKGAGVPWREVVKQGIKWTVEALKAGGPEDVPDSVWEIIAQALYLDPHKRPKGPRGFLEGLEPTLKEWEERPRTTPSDRARSVDLASNGGNPSQRGPDLTKIKSPDEVLPPLKKDTITGRVLVPGAGPHTSHSEPFTQDAPTTSSAVALPPLVVSTSQPPGTLSPLIVAPPKLPEAPVVPAVRDRTAWDEVTVVHQPSASRYRQIKELAQGTNEYIAWDERTATNVHLKLLTPSEAERLRQFYEPVSRASVQEIFSGRARDHVVRVLDLETEVQIPYLVTELLFSPSTLDERLQSGPLDPSTALLHLDALAKVLTQLAQRNLAHGDLRPANLLFVHVGGHEVLKVARCGLAHPKTSPVISPEQWLERSANPRTDVWALGLTAFHMLTGRPFWRSPDDGALLQEQILGVIPAASSRAEVTGGFESWFAQCVAKDPEARFGSADEAFRDLKRVLGPMITSPPSADRVLPVHSTSHSPKSRPLKSLPTGLASVLSVAVTDDLRWLMAGGIPTRPQQGERPKPVTAWMLETQQQINLREGMHLDTVRKVAAAGTFFATASADEHVCSWNMETGDTRRFTHKTPRFPVDAVAIVCDPKPHIVAAGPEGIPTHWNGWADEYFRPLAAELGHRNAILDIDITRDGAHVITAGGDHEVVVWDIRTKRRVRVLRGHAGAVRCVALSQDGRMVLSGARDRTVRVWSLDEDDRKDDFVQMLEGHESDVNSVVFIPGRKEALSASCDGTVRRWDLQTGQCLDVYEGHFYTNGSRASVWCLAWLGDDRFASGGSDGWLRIWSLQDR